MVKVQQAATMAFAHGFISDLPNGYDTEIGHRGSLLSGGQKQRVAIARSVVSQPKIILLDEATSALDPHAESLVQKALDKASEGRTTIVIAHKLATIRKADNIIVMSKGSIVEHGTHDSLLARDGMYAQLVKIQDLAVSSHTSQSELDLDAGNDSKLEPVTKTSARTSYASVHKDNRSMPEKECGDYDDYKQQNITMVIYRLIRQTPELSFVYSLVLAGCLVGGMSVQAPVSFNF